MVATARLSVANATSERAATPPSDKERRSRPARASAQPAVEIGLSAAIVAVSSDEPQVLTVPATCDGAPCDALPSGAFSPLVHRTLEIGLRSWVSDQTALDLGYAEQLYTFGDRGRHAQPADDQPHVVSIGYLALTRFLPGRSSGETLESGARWRSWYEYFPWEDWRKGRPTMLLEDIEASLVTWAADEQSGERAISRAQRVQMAYGFNGGSWDEERVLDRYELLYEAGLVEEARRDGRPAALARQQRPKLGRDMQFDHRRILATAIGRLRGKIKYRPVVFELMPDEFTLFELQKTVEAILGPHLHKQNFRRLVESAGLVEPTGEVRAKTGGRPAKLYRFRRDVLLERPSPGVRVKPGRL